MWLGNPAGSWRPTSTTIPPMARKLSIRPLRPSSHSPRPTTDHSLSQPLHYEIALNREPRTHTPICSPAGALHPPPRPTANCNLGVSPYPVLLEPLPGTRRARGGTRNMTRTHTRHSTHTTHDTHTRHSIHTHNTRHTRVLHTCRTHAAALVRFPRVCPSPPSSPPSRAGQRGHRALRPWPSARRPPPRVCAGQAAAPQPPQAPLSPAAARLSASRAAGPRTSAAPPPVPPPTPPPRPIG
jgi:hypothetical protein